MTETLPAKARDLAEHLERRVATESEHYVKSRFVAEDVDLSAKEVGSYMPRLDDVTSLTVEWWADTNGTTWRATSEK